MNVDDIKSEVIPTDFSVHDKLDLIFMRQHYLTEKYLPIEKSNGLRWTSDVPVNLNDKFGQALLKDYFWRVTEELTEAVQAQTDHPDIKNHVLEELADATHFLVETYILAGVGPVDLVGETVTKRKYQGEDKLDHFFVGPKTVNLILGSYHVIHLLGCASNCLKQRPWKITHQLIDKGQFLKFLKPAMWELMSIFRFLGLTPDEVFAMYWKKSEVNKFRQRSNY